MTVIKPIYRLRLIALLALFVFAQISVAQHAATHIQHAPQASCASFLSADSNQLHCAASQNLLEQVQPQRFEPSVFYHHHSTQATPYLSRAPPLT